MFIERCTGHGELMPAAKTRIVHKHYLLDQSKILRAQRLLGARTETGTLERALDAVITERERNRLTREATLRLLNSRARIRDVYGMLEG